MICWIVARTLWKDVKPGLCFLGATSEQVYLLLATETICAPNGDPLLKLMFFISKPVGGELLTIHRTPDNEIEMNEDRIVTK